MLTTATRTSFFSIVLVVAALGCGKPNPVGDDSEPPVGNPPTAAGSTVSAGDAAAKAKEIFGQRCTPCHGPAGAGDGPASASLNPHPRNFTDKAWQASVTDEHVEKIIKFGGTAVGKSPAMPGNPDLSDPAVIAALRGVIRGFGS